MSTPTRVARNRDKSTHGGRLGALPTGWANPDPVVLLEKFQGVAGDAEIAFGYHGLFEIAHLLGVARIVAEETAKDLATRKTSTATL